MPPFRNSRRPKTCGINFSHPDCATRLLKAPISFWIRRRITGPFLNTISHWEALMRPLRSCPMKSIPRFNSETWVMSCYTHCLRKQLCSLLYSSSCPFSGWRKLDRGGLRCLSCCTFLQSGQDSFWSRYRCFKNIFSLWDNLCIRSPRCSFRYWHARDWGLWLSSISLKKGVKRNGFWWSFVWSEFLFWLRYL